MKLPRYTVSTKLIHRIDLADRNYKYPIRQPNSVCNTNLKEANTDDLVAQDTT